MLSKAISLQTGVMADQSNNAMSQAHVKVRVWQMKETPRALQCARALPATFGAAVFYVWIPLSLCTHISRRDNGAIWPEVTITLPAWKARELNLEEVG